MKFSDLQTVERHVADIVSGTGCQLPAMLSKEYDRVDIDATALTGMDLPTFVDRLAQSLGRKGYVWDVWRDSDSGSSGRFVHVSEREEEG